MGKNKIIQLFNRKKINYEECISSYNEWKKLFNTILFKEKQFHKDTSNCKLNEIIQSIKLATKYIVSNTLRFEGLEIKGILENDIKIMINSKKIPSGLRKNLYELSTFNNLKDEYTLIENISYEDLCQVERNIMNIKMIGKWFEKKYFSDVKNEIENIKLGTSNANNNKFNLRYLSKVCYLCIFCIIGFLCVSRFKDHNDDKQIVKSESQAWYTDYSEIRSEIREKLPYSTIKYIDKNQQLCNNDLDLVIFNRVDKYGNLYVSFSKDRIWRDVDNSEYNFRVNYEGGSAQTIDMIIEELGKEENHVYDIEQENKVEGANLYLSLKEENEDEHVKNFKNLISNGVDEIVNEEIYEIISENNLIQNDELINQIKYEIHPGRYQNMNIYISKREDYEDQVRVQVHLYSYKTGRMYLDEEPMNEQVYKYHLKSQKIVDFLNSIQYI